MITYTNWTPATQSYYHYLNVSSFEAMLAYANIKHSKTKKYGQSETRSLHTSSIVTSEFKFSFDCVMDTV